MICKECGKFYFKGQGHVHAIVHNTESLNEDQKQLYKNLIKQMMQKAGE